MPTALEVAYPLLTPLLFRLEGERSHDVGLACLAAAQDAGLAGLLGGGPFVRDPVRLLDLRFPNRVGLAAGLDKDARITGAAHAIGFGFVEAGTVTPRPQPGNPRPRLFRLRRDRALINRMGFNSEGLEAFVGRLRRRRDRGILGVNLGKNRATPLEEAARDYARGLEAVYAFADYVTVNLSSPNTPGLRGLQESTRLVPLLDALERHRERLARRHRRRLPMLVKIAPDLDEAQLHGLAHLLRDAPVDGVIATNTTLARPALRSAGAAEAGGLSGAPLRDRARAVVGAVAEGLEGRKVVVGVGGVLSGADAAALRDAGADLVQLYTGFIYRGPGLVRECVEAIG